MRDDEPVTVYYDGLCPVCSREVAMYQRLDRPRQIRWQNLLAGAVDSIDLDAAYRLLHVRDADGQLHVGFAAHLLMWERLPGFRLLAWTLRRCHPGAWVAERTYLWLTARRPGLARRQCVVGGSHA